MASYKVIQDIEAEDKLVGPLTLRQFIYGCIAAICAYLSFLAITKGLSLALIFTFPPMLFTGFFAVPWGRDQSTEVWALAKIRFFLKSRRRLWDQTGVKDLVTITAPKREIKRQTNGLSQVEVQSRLSALANTLDTRGWAVKNVYSIPSLASQNTGDRLIDISNLPQEVPTATITAADDMLDVDNNPRAQQLTQMVATATANHKQQLLDEMRSGTIPAPVTPQGMPDNYWFMQAPAEQSRVVTNEAQLDAVLQEHHAEVAAVNEHLKTINPLVSPAPAPQPVASKQAKTPAVNPAIIAAYAQNKDLNIATIARQANKEAGSNEVVISLHGRK